MSFHNLIGNLMKSPKLAFHNSHNCLITHFSHFMKKNSQVLNNCCSFIHCFLGLNIIVR